MANIRTTVYGTFRGADFSTDPSLVERYRSPLCTNIMADNGGMPEKRPGWRVLQSLTGTVYGLFSLDGELLATWAASSTDGARTARQPLWSF